MDACESEIFLKENGVDLNTLNGNVYEIDMEDYMASHALREKYIERFGFAVLTRDVVNVLVKYSPILEIGCGSGYWTYELNKAGADCIATDPGKGMYCGVENGWEKLYAEIDRVDGITAIAKYPARALLIVWPDYDSSWPYEALKVYEGTTVLYVGEGRGGCTGDDAFHDWLGSHYYLKEDVDIPQFYGIRDSLQVWTRAT